jgi:hypothetical protein
MKNKEAILEGVKQLIRVSVLAVIPLVISQLQEKSGVDWRAVLISFSIAFLMGLDKLGHEKGVESPLDLKGMDSLIKK